MLSKTILFSVLVSLLYGCSNPANDTGKKKSASSNIIISGLHAEPRLLNTDSIQVLFYNDPFGDSLRYTRFYKYVATADTSLIKNVLSNLDQVYVAVARIKECRSEGKMHCYAKGEVVKTIYFATRCDSCCYLYYIKNGEFLYFNLNGTLIKQLNNWKRIAVKLGTHNDVVTSPPVSD